MRTILAPMLAIALGLAAFLTAPAASSQAPVAALNGIAIHSEFGRPLFIGALYSSSLSDNSETLSKAAALRMELKIVAAEGLTLRRFSRMWSEAIAVNTPVAILSAQADNLLLFDSLFKDRLQQNDSILISFKRNHGITVSLNSHLLGRIDNDDFFAILLHTWIGSVPLSTDYKNGVLQAGKVATDLHRRFDSIHASAERAREIGQWLKPAASSVSGRESLGNTGKPTSATAKKTHAAASSSSSITAPPKAAANSATAVSSPAATAPLNAQVLLARQLYISQLLQKIRLNTRYPQRANELGQSASLRIALVIDRRGNILSTSFVQGSRYAQLNQAALDAIQKSAPLPPMPELLTEASFEFTVPISFVSAGKQ